MKTKEELKALKEEVETVSRKRRELTEEELEQVTGGDVLPGGNVIVLPGGDVLPGGNVIVLPGGDVIVVPSGKPPVFPTSRSE